MDNDGDSALHVAFQEGHSSIVELLLASKADIHLKNNNGKTPSEVAHMNGHSDCVRILQALNF